MTNREMLQKLDDDRQARLDIEVGRVLRSNARSIWWDRNGDIVFAASWLAGFAALGVVLGWAVL